MMTTDRLAELYKKVLQLEERFEAIERKAKNMPKTDAIALQERRRRVTEAKDALAAARKEFSDAINSYNRPFRSARHPYNPIKTLLCHEWRQPPKEGQPHHPGTGLFLAGANLLCLNKIVH